MNQNNMNQNNMNQNYMNQNYRNNMNRLQMNNSNLSQKSTGVTCKSNNNSLSKENDNEVKPMSEHDIVMKKIEFLRRFEELKDKNVRISQNYTINSTLEEMEQEYALLTSIQDKKNGVKLYKNFMMNAITAMEFLNERYDPFGFKLKGWSEHMSVSVEDYDEVFAELYEKYKGKGRKVEPEIKLVMMILISAGSFHASNT
jgi:hypothetical protein